MEQRPSCEANSFSASQEIAHILWNPEVHYRIHKSPLPVPILGQLNPVHSTEFFTSTHTHTRARRHARAHTHVGNYEDFYIKTSHPVEEFWNMFVEIYDMSSEVLFAS
jgi:hypothetical protein